MERGIILEAESVSLRYGRKEVLSSVNLELAQGELLVVLGPNGSGKSTLLKALLGILSPYSGTLTRDVAEASPAVIGYVPQRFQLRRSLPTTVQEFVLLGHVGSLRARVACERALPETLQLVGLRGKKDESYWSLSGGQQQRALLARALIRNPRLLILDEPTVGLDIVVQRSLLSMVRELSTRERMTAIVVTHDLEVARELASKVILIARRTVEVWDSARELSAESISRSFTQDEMVEC